MFICLESIEVSDIRIELIETISGINKCIRRI